LEVGSQAPLSEIEVPFPAKSQESQAGSSALGFEKVICVVLQNRFGRKVGIPEPAGRCKKAKRKSRQVQAMGWISRASPPVAHGSVQAAEGSREAGSNVILSARG